MGHGEEGVLTDTEIRPAGSAASVVIPAGTVVLVTSVNRLKTRYSDFAVYVEAPIPEHNHEAQTSERTLTPARAASPDLTDTRD